MFTTIYGGITYNTYDNKHLLFLRVRVVVHYKLLACVCVQSHVRSSILCITGYHITLTGMTHVVTPFPIFIGSKVIHNNKKLCNMLTIPSTRVVAHDTHMQKKIVVYVF